MKINKPEIKYHGHLHLQYTGKNYTFFQERSLSKIVIIGVDNELKEELVVSLTMFDGTEIKFSMISSHLYIKVNDKYVLQGQDEEQDRQSFCDFELLMTDELILFDGTISYHKNFEPFFSFIENFKATIIINNNKAQLLEIWKKKPN